MFVHIKKLAQYSIVMEPKISFGVLIVDIGFGLSSQHYYQKPEVPGTVTCHREIVETDQWKQEPLVELGSAGVVTIKCWWSLVLSQPHTFSPSKCKGKKTYFGIDLGLQCQ